MVGKTVSKLNISNQIYLYHLSILLLTFKIQEIVFNFFNKMYLT